MKWYEDPVYIKMSDCKEIQKLWKPQTGDWFYKEDGIGSGLWLISDIQEYGEKPYLDTVLYCSGERMHNPPFGMGLVEFRDPENYIWLPTQSQLQEMVIRTGRDVKPEYFPMLLYFSDWASQEARLCEFYEHRPFPQSMEQLWLAFVMKENHNKVWNELTWKEQVESNN